MSICYSCEDILGFRKIICTQCTHSFCGVCSTRLFLNEQTTCLRCQFADNLREANLDLVDPFNVNDLRWVLSQHYVYYRLDADKDELVELLAMVIKGMLEEEEEEELEVEEEDAQQDFGNEVLPVDFGVASVEDNATDSNTENRQCKICFSGPANHVFISCGHVMACDKCAPLVKNCPMCRRKITSFIKIFFS